MAYKIEEIMQQARGIRNNNPGNIKLSNTAWKGKVPNDQNTDGTFEQFQDMPHGIRAVYRLLITYANKHKLRTVDEIIDRWAPSGENSETARANYKRFVLDLAGTDIMATPSDLQKFAAGIMSFENGGNQYLNFVLPFEQQAAQISNLQDLEPYEQKKKICL